MSHEAEVLAEALSTAQVKEFVECGYTVLPQAVPADVVNAVVDRIWSRLGRSPDAGSTPLPARQAYIKETLTGAPFQDAYTPRVHAAFDQLLGQGRWTNGGWLGFWPILSAGYAEKPWIAPSEGWHIDGGHFRRRLWAGDRALLTLFLFSDVGPGDGGTAVSVGSHRIVADLLAEAEPAGMTHRELVNAANRIGRPEVREVTGRAGDVVLMHPYLMHAQSVNTGDRARIMANPYVAVHDRMSVPWGTSDSPVERAIRDGVGELGRLAASGFRPTAVDAARPAGTPVRGAQARDLARPDTLALFTNGSSEIVRVGRSEVTRFALQPGFRWTANNQLMNGPVRCQGNHVGFVVSGRICFQTADGGTVEAGPGETYWCPPDHDKWVLGDEQCVLLEFAGT